MKFIKLLLATLIVFQFLFNSVQGMMHPGRVLFKAKLKPKETLTIFYNDDDIIEFVNAGFHDTLVFKSVEVSASTEFRYGISYIQQGKPTIIRHNFFLSPGDSISFQKKELDLKPLYKSKEQLFMDYWLKPVKVSQAYTPTVVSKKNDLQQTYHYNLHLIDSLYSKNTIEALTASNWKMKTELDYFVALVHLLNDSVTENRSNRDDMIVKQAMSKMASFQKLTCPANKELIIATTKYFLIVEGKNPADVINNINFTIVHSSQFGPISSVIIYNWLKYYPYKSDKSFQIALSNSKAFFAKNKSSFLGKLSEFEVHTFTNFGSVRLKDSKLEQHTLKEVLLTTKEKFILIDLWASWCVPCRQQMPIIEKSKRDSTLRHILFISLSIDQDSEEDAWLKALKQEKLTIHQFRILGGKQSPLYTFFNVQTIPRYILMNKNGVVINSQFLTPDDPDFKQQLIEHTTSQQLSH